MCWSCNAYCGNCKPPKEKPRMCTQCKAVNFDLEATQCRKCGTELPPRILPKTVFCLYCGLMCANPCKKAEKAPLDGVCVPCKLRTPPKDEASENNQ